MSDCQRNHGGGILAFALLQRQIEDKRRLKTDATADTLTDSPKNIEGGWFVVLGRRISNCKTVSDESAT